MQHHRRHTLLAAAGMLALPGLAHADWPTDAGSPLVLGVWRLSTIISAVATFAHLGIS